MSKKSKQNACSSSATTSPMLGCIYLVHKHDLLPIKNLERRSGGSWQIVASASQNNAKKHNHHRHLLTRSIWNVSGEKRACTFFLYIYISNAFCIVHFCTQQPAGQGCFRGSLFTWAKLSYLQIKYSLCSSFISLTDEVIALLKFAPPAGMIAIKLARLVRNVQKEFSKKRKTKMSLRH